MNHGGVVGYTMMPYEEILGALITINSSNPPGNEDAVAQFIREYASSRGIPGTFQTISHGPGRSSLLFSLPGDNPDITVGFAGHMDTVPAGNSEDWLFPPFHPVQKDGFMYGRGAVDMKGGLTAMISLLLLYIHKAPPVNIRCFFTAGEEADGMGITALRDMGCFDDVSFLFVCEPTDCYPAVCEKGVGWYDFTFNGRTSHAAMPDLGINAFEEGFLFLREIKSSIEHTSPEDPVLGKNSFSITQGSAGVTINIIPDYAHFAADIRLIPGTDWNALESLFAATVRKFENNKPGLAIHCTGKTRRPAIASDTTHTAVQSLLRQCAKNGKKPVGVMYFTDASLVIPYYPKLPFVILGPGKSAECHSPNEKIALASIEEAVETYRHFIENIPLTG